MFNYLKKDDPYLGDGTFGQLARFGPERCAVMHLQLLDLENKWDTKVEFERYNMAYNTSDPAVQEFLDNSTEVFFRRFRYIFDKHMVKKWTSTEVVHYLLGGDPHHAKEFARWLVYHKKMNDLTKGTPCHAMQKQSNPSTPAATNKFSPAMAMSTKSTNSTSKELVNTPTVNGHDGEFMFEKKIVTLGKHHTMTHGDVKIDLHESMNFITQYADPLVILNDQFVTKNWEHINSLADEKVAVNIWGKATRANEKYEPLVLDVIHQICIHSSHQQL